MALTADELRVAAARASVWPPGHALEYCAEVEGELLW